MRVIWEILELSVIKVEEELLIDLKNYNIEIKIKVQVKIKVGSINLKD